MIVKEDIDSNDLDALYDQAKAIRNAAEQLRELSFRSPPVFDKHEREDMRREINMIEANLHALQARFLRDG